MPFEQLIPRPFTSLGVEMYAPATTGIYGISNAREWIYIGEADDTRGALLQHLREGDTAMMKHQPAGYVFEVCASDQRPRRQHRLILEYQPACNRQNRSDHYAHKLGE